MLACWRKEPESRPLFDELETSISKLLDANVATYYVNLNEPYLRANVAKFEGGKTDYVSAMGSPDFQAPSVPSESALERNTIVEGHH